MRSLKKYARTVIRIHEFILIYSTYTLACRPSHKCINTCQYKKHTKTVLFVDIGHISAWYYPELYCLNYSVQLLCTSPGGLDRLLFIAVYKLSPFGSSEWSDKRRV